MHITFQMGISIFGTNFFYVEFSSVLNRKKNGYRPFCGENFEIDLQVLLEMKYVSCTYSFNFNSAWKSIQFGILEY